MNLDLPTDNALGLLTILSLKGVGKQTAPRLAKAFGSLREIFEASDSQLAELVTKPVLRSIRDHSMWYAAFDKAQQSMFLAKKHSVQVIGIGDENYPKQLRAIPDPPAILYVKGNLPEDRGNVACVGTRHPTWFGVEVTRRIVRVLSSEGWRIISGLAVGIDTESHRMALECGGQTIAILANGLDSIYPAENRGLAHDILDRGGALISEQPIGTRAYAQHLVERDRLQSGMSIGTFVMQTDIVGGTMHTVRFTLAQNRLLFAPVPPQQFADEEKCQGIRAIAELRGPHLADKVRAVNDYRYLLETAFYDFPPAFPIRGQEDYEAVLSKLNNALKT